VVRLVRSIKPKLKGFTNDTYIDELAANETWLAQGWSGDVFQAQDQNPDVSYVIPKVQARISKYVSYGTPVSLSKPLLPADQTSDPAIYPPAATKLSIITLTGQKLRKWQAAYDAIVK
jgi:spermidine/putrescine-binding protein